MTDRQSRVPQGRFGRLAALGQLAAGMAVGAVGEGLGRLAQGDRPHLSDLLMTPSNARRVAEQLSRMRGAAMKLGQMLSLDAGDFLPPELTAILSQLRDKGHVMPQGQLDQSLRAAWGPAWREAFARFDMVPMAAASIGQVHRAALKSGREIVVKVQYPGISASIDADIDNVATLLRMSGLLPRGLDIGPQLAAAKQQLHEEADYLREAEQMRAYRTHLGGDPRFLVPSPVEDLLRPTVLAMDYLPGEPIEALSRASEPERRDAAQALLDLVLRELFKFRLMQTDPNFANYRWQRESGRIVLLDFGAARPVAAETAEHYRKLLQAGLAGDRTAVRGALIAGGFVSPAQDLRHGRTIEAMIDLTLRQSRIRGDGLFDFADRSVVAAIRGQAAPMLADRDSWHVPPAETLFTQRKISGMALLFVELRARLPLLDTAAAYASSDNRPRP